MLKVGSIVALFVGQLYSLLIVLRDKLIHVNNQTDGQTHLRQCVFSPPDQTGCRWDKPTSANAGILMPTHTSSFSPLQAEKKKKTFLTPTVLSHIFRRAVSEVEVIGFYSSRSRAGFTACDPT